MKKFKKWLIRKLGGYTEQKLDVVNTKFIEVQPNNIRTIEAREISGFNINNKILKEKLSDKISEYIYTHFDELCTFKIEDDIEHCRDIAIARIKVFINNN